MSYYKFISHQAVQKITFHSTNFQLFMKYKYFVINILINFFSKFLQLNKLIINNWNKQNNQITHNSNLCPNYNLINELKVMLTSKIFLSYKLFLLIFIFIVFACNYSHAINIKALAEPFTFTVSKPSIAFSDQNQKIVVATLTIFVASNHHIYKDSFTISCDENIEIKYKNLPTKVKFDQFSNKEVEVIEEGTYYLLLSFVPKVFNSSFTLTINYQGCSSTTCFLPQEQKFFVQISQDSIDKFSKNNNNLETSANIKNIEDTLKNDINSKSSSLKNDLSESIYAKFIAGNIAEIFSNNGVLIPIILAFLAGFLVSLTPCVYPLIPITLSIIGIHNQLRSMKQGLFLSISYVFGLSITYSLLGILVAYFGAYVRSLIHGSVFQIIVAAMFGFLGLAMFDVFTFTLPFSSMIIQKSIVKDERKNLLRVFYIGLLSGIMASPCVAAPLAGILTYIASTGSVVYGFVLLFAFAWGMGIIFVVLGTFAGWLEALPKAGEWMINVKEIYGFLMLGASVYFASPVLGYPWSAFLTSLLLASLAGYLGLFGPVSEYEFVFGRVKRSIAVVVLSVACAFAISAACQWGGLCLLTPNISNSLVVEKNYQIKWYSSLDEARIISAKEGKPIFVDFRADWCSVCKELEQNIFTDLHILETFEKFILVKIDLTNLTEYGKRVSSDYKVIGLPTLLFLKPDGVEVSELRVTGYISKENLLQRLQKVLEMSK